MSVGGQKEQEEYERSVRRGQVEHGRTRVRGAWEQEESEGIIRTEINVRGAWGHEDRRSVR